MEAQWLRFGVLLGAHLIGSSQPVFRNGAKGTRSIPAFLAVLDQGNDLRLKLDYTTKEAGAYPILLVTYEIVCSKNADATKAANIKAE